MEYRIVLASGSAARKELLDENNMKFEIIPSGADEEELNRSIVDPRELVERLSYIKAIDVFDKIKDENKKLIVIGADTVVYYNGKILGKPKNSENAIAMLQELQGNMNTVYTGMTVIIKDNDSLTKETSCNKGDVYFKQMTNQDILDYVATNEPLSKAGGYAIKGIAGMKYIEKYVGDFDTIVGLNITKLKNILNQYLKNVEDVERG
ncbi:MAG: Maf family protein [Oscillospiraceae bacterium]|nr:Maf family protein [Oscillospiraceae bacterium]